MSPRPEASIVILTYNNLDLTRSCLESIFAKTDEPTFEVIVVDNASQDGTVQFLHEIEAAHPEVRLILNEQNQGFARGNNQGAEAAVGNYLVFLNNDTVVTQGWLSGFIRHLQDPQVGMVGPVTNASGNETRIPVDYTGLDGMDDFAEQYAQAHVGQATDISMLPFLCLAIRRSVFEEIGGLDERFGTGMFEDDDYALRVKQKGYRILCAEDVFIHHWGSASFSKLGVSQYWDLFNRNLRLFREKWGAPWQPHVPRPQLLPEQVRSMTWDAIERGTQIVDRDHEIAARDREIADRDHEIAALKGELQEIHVSRAWKLVRILWSVRLVIAPHGSLRARLLGTVFHGLTNALQAVLQGWQWLQQKLARPMISWEAYVFKRFKFSRSREYLSRLDALRCPSVEGKVSIILPVYNGADFVAEAIESILAQTYTNFELIIVDDGSTDQTPEIIEKIAHCDQRIRVIHQLNQRLPRSLNNGFRMACGEFLTWTSADNRLKPDCIEKLVGCLHRHPEWDMVYANMDLIDEEGQPMRNSSWYSGYQTPPSSEHISLPVDPSELNIIANNYVGAAFMYRDRVHLLLGDFNPWRFGTEDYDYWMRVNALFNLHHAEFSDPVYEYRFHSTSLTSKDEELGITSSRTGLMVFEDARRDFYLVPLAWRIEESDNPQGSALGGRIHEWVKRAQHVDISKAALYQPYRLWFPLVCVKIACSPAEAQTLPDWPANALKVLVMTLESPLPTSVNSSWDLCLTTSPQANPPRLDQPRQGWLAANNIDALCTAVDIYARSYYLTKLEEEILNPPSPVCKVSVVISTYRRNPQLADAIRSVAHQTLSPEDYEVIIVNNDPQDQSVLVLVEELRNTDFADCPERLRLVACPFKGLSFARNAGISEAGGEIISFLDDDATALPDWLEQVWLAFKDHPQAGVVGGKIKLVAPQKHPYWLKPGWEHYWGNFTPTYSETKVADNWWEFPWGGNWSARRKALVEIGGFRANYGRRGTGFNGGEELVAASLIQRLGYTIIVAPTAEVHHVPQASRYSFTYVRKTIQASKLSEYTQQIDLYISERPNRSMLKHSRSTHLSRALFAPTLEFYQRVEEVLYAWTYTNLLRRLRLDLRNRQR